LSSCDRFFVRYISSLSHHVENSFVRLELHVLCTITFVPAQQDGRERSKCHKHAADALIPCFLIVEGLMKHLTSSRLLLFHPSTYLPTYASTLTRSTPLPSTTNHVSTPPSKSEHDRRRDTSSLRNSTIEEEGGNVFVQAYDSTAYPKKIVASLDISAFDAHPASFDGAYTATDGVVGSCTNTHPRTCSIT
jgi:hypothetical protein